MGKNYSTEEKKKIVHKAIADWKKEYRNYRCWVNVYLLITFIPFFLASIILFRYNPIFGYFCTVFTCGYVLLAIVPSLNEWGKIDRCNLNNIHNIRVGVIRRKYYRQRKFSIFIAERSNYKELDIVRVTELQFDRFRVGDKIIYFEFYPGAFAVTYMPEELYDNDIEELEKDIYTPTIKDIEGFIKFRREITSNDNYLFYSIILAILSTGIAIGIETSSYILFSIFTILPLAIVIFIYMFIVKPYYPFKVSEIENCLQAKVLEKEPHNKKYYYGKKYYYITVINSKGDVGEKIRVLKKTFDELKKGDKVICFDYRRPTLMLGATAAIRDIN